MSVILRIDVDRPYGKRSIFRQLISRISSDVFFPKIDKMGYLDDLKMDKIYEEVLAVNHEGKTRMVKVAAVKKERRDVSIIKAKYGDKIGTTCSQNAETVRLVSPDGSIPVTEIKPGDLLKVYISKPVATHAGQIINEHIVEL